MSEIRKLPASAGAEWLVSGFTLLRRAPLGLGLLGVLWVAAALVVMALAALSPALASLGQLLMAVAGPLFFAGVVWAVREVDQGRAPHTRHLLQGLHDGRAPNLLVALLPQLVAGLVLGVLLFVLIGTDGLKELGVVMDRLQQISQSGVQPSPEEMEALISSLPAARILLWVLCVVGVAIAVALALFTLPPQVMFEHRNGLQALKLSLQASLHNLLPMAVFVVLSMIAVFAVYFAVTLIALIAQLLVGSVAAMLLAQVLLMAVAMPVFAGAVYTAWKQMFGQDTDAPPPLPGDVFQA